MDKLKEEFEKNKENENLNDKEKLLNNEKSVLLKKYLKIKGKNINTLKLK